MTPEEFDLVDAIMKERKKEDDPQKRSWLEEAIWAILEGWPFRWRKGHEPKEGVTRH